MSRETWFRAYERGESERAERAERYRVNFGNGQVHYPGSRRACEQHIASMELYRAYAFVELLDNQTGDWFQVR